VTFSLVAHDAADGRLGVAVATCALAVGRSVPWARGGVGAIATQAHTDRAYGARGLDLLAGGASPEAALHQLLAEDTDADARQVALVDRHGRVSAWTGGSCLSACGHVTGDGFAAQGNMLASRSVVPTMAEAFVAADGELADRLLVALAAAEDAGGDVRGRQSAALLVVADEPTDRPWDAVPVDLRVDDAAEPVAELRRLFELQRAYEQGDWATLGGTGTRRDAGALRRSRRRPPRRPAGRSIRAGRAARPPRDERRTAPDADRRSAAACGRPARLRA
jgi:uncharacterized Ntn-hydrolase superfamily protein